MLGCIIDWPEIRGMRRRHPFALQGSPEYVKRLRAFLAEVFGEEYKHIAGL